MSARDTSAHRLVRNDHEPVVAVAVPTISRLAVQGFVHGIGLLDVDVPRVLARCDLDAAALAALPERVPYTLMRRLYVAVHEVTGRPGVGLRIAEQVRPETWEMLGYVIRSSGTLGDALMRAGRYLRLLSDAAELGLHVEGARALVVYRTPYAELAHADIAEFALAAIATFGRHLSGRALVPIEVRFSHAAPADTDLHARVFGAPVRFARPHDALVFDEALLHLPIPSRDPHLCTLLERQAEQVLATLPEPRRFSRTVRDAIAAGLAQGRHGAEAVAARLGVHPKALSRRLRAEGTSHRAVLEAVRRELAERYLTVSEKTVSEVAFLLGYADPSAFHKAFRRWTGVAPDDYRRRVRFAAAG